MSDPLIAFLSGVIIQALLIRYVIKPWPPRASSSSAHRSITMTAAIAALNVALHTLETNEPIHRAAGDTVQANSDLTGAAEVRSAIAKLKGE